MTSSYWSPYPLNLLEYHLPLKSVGSWMGQSVPNSILLQKSSCTLGGTASIALPVQVELDMVLRKTIPYKTICRVNLYVVLKKVFKTKDKLVTRKIIVKSSNCIKKSRLITTKIVLPPVYLNCNVLPYRLGYFFDFWCDMLSMETEKFYG
jgi:hypothetical protein